METVLHIMQMKFIAEAVIWQAKMHFEIISYKEEIDFILYWSSVSKGRERHIKGSHSSH